MRANRSIKTIATKRLWTDAKLWKKRRIKPQRYKQCNHPNNHLINLHRASSSLLKFHCCLTVKTFVVIMWEKDKTRICSSISILYNGLNEEFTARLTNKTKQSPLHVKAGGDWLVETSRNELHLKLRNWRKPTASLQASLQTQPLLQNTWRNSNSLI